MGCDPVSCGCDPVSWARAEVAASSRIAKATETFSSAADNTSPRFLDEKETLLLPGFLLIASRIPESPEPGRLDRGCGLAFWGSSQVSKVYFKRLRFTSRKRIRESKRFGRIASSEAIAIRC